MRFVQMVMLLLSLFVTTVTRASDNLILGVQDFGKSPRLLVVEFRGLADYLGTQLGVPVRVEAVQSYKRYMGHAQDQRYAFMYGPPSMAIKAYQKMGYEPIAKAPGSLSASFITLASSNVAFPEDMKGKRIGMPAADSLVTQLALAKLRSMKIDPTHYFASVQTFNEAGDVISALKLGLIDVGVANSSLYNVWSAKGYDLNVLLQSSSTPHLTFSVRGDLPADLKLRTVQALQKAHQNKTAQSYFQYAGVPNFEATSIKDYQDTIKLLSSH